MGYSPDLNDKMILDFTNGKSVSGFGHPDGNGGNDAAAIIADISKNFPTGPKGK